MDDTRMAGSGTREWGDRWSVAPIGGRCLDRPLAQAFIGGVGRGRGRGVVTSAARPDYRPSSFEAEIMEVPKMKHPTRDPSSLVIGYLTLRKAIGLLGTSLPFVLSLGAFLLFNTGIQASMSSYYHTGRRDVFVGTLCAIGIFMLSYRGYERQDDVADDLACVFAVGVALFPTTLREDLTTLDTIGALHLVFAALLFLTLAYFSLFLFTKTDPTKTPTR